MDVKEKVYKQRKMLEEAARERREKYLRLHEVEKISMSDIARAENIDIAVVSRLIKKARKEKQT